MLTENIVRRVCSEFLEMPGLRLTQAQAQRLWGLDTNTCAEVLRFLVRARFLSRSQADTYARSTDGEVARPPYEQLSG